MPYTNRKNIKFVKAAALVLAIVLAVAFAAGCAGGAGAEAQDISTGRIGVMTGSTGEAYALEHYPEADVQMYDSIMDAVLALKAEQADYVITAYTLALNLKKNDDGLTYLPEGLTEEENIIAIQKGNDGLREEIDGVLTQFKEDGTLDGIISRWIREDGSDYEQADIPAVQDGPELRVGISTGREPMVFVQDNEYVGLDCELIERIAYELGMKVSYSDMTFSAMIPALVGGKVDCVISNLSGTEERKKQVDFSIPYFRNPQVIVTRSGGQAELPDMSAARLAVTTGTMAEQLAQRDYPDAEVQSYASSGDLVLAVKSGQADYAINSYTVIVNAVNENPDLIVVPGVLEKISVAVATGKDNAELKERIDDVLRQFREDGTLDEVISHWVREDGTDYELADVPVREDGEELTVGIDALNEPMVFVQDNEYVGLDCELIERIAYELGMKVKYSDMAFSALVPALAAGKVDCVISDMTPTEERERYVDFTQPYFENSLVAMARNPESYEGQPWYESIKESFIGNFVTEDRWMLIVQGLLTTLVISVCAAGLGTLIGFGICMMRMSRRRVPRAIARVYIDIVRGVPVLVLLMLIYYVVLAGLDLNPVFVSIVTFAVNFAAYVSELMRTSIESVDRGQMEAATATGFSKAQQFTLIVFPQAARIALPVYRGELISMVKMTSVVGYIAIMDLTKASDIIRARTFDAAFPLIVTAILYFILSTLLVSFLSRLEIKIDPRKRKRKVKLDD